MTAEELMIGDWYANSDGNKCRVIKNFCKEVWGEGDDVSDATDNPLPIPVTPEILENNGWQKSEDKYGRECYCFTNPDAHYDDGAYYFDSGFFVFKNFGVDLAKQITQVHELQRALRLCELWELAENFRV